MAWFGQSTPSEANGSDGSPRHEAGRAFEAHHRGGGDALAVARALPREENLETGMGNPPIFMLKLHPHQHPVSLGLS